MKDIQAPFNRQVTKLSTLTPIYEAGTLLNTAFRKDLLQKLQALLPLEFYQDFYLPIIEQFAIYVQMLPIARQGPFSASMLDHGISRAVYGINLCLSYFFPESKDFRSLSLSDPKALWLYTLFSAALFLDIGNLLAYYQITLYRQDTLLTKPWIPFMGAMSTMGATAYCFDYTEKNWEGLQPLSNSCLAVSILEKAPKTQQGFFWITSCPETLEAWISVLSGEGARLPTHSIMRLIPFADREAIDRWQVLHSSRSQKIGIFRSHESLSEQAIPDRTQGERFLQWIREGIEKGAISVNSDDRSGARMTEAGVLIARYQLEEFSRQQGQDIQAVEQQFRETVALYPSAVNERARLSSAMGGVAQAYVGQWLLAHNPALIFGLGKIPPLYMPGQPVPFQTTKLPQP